MAHSAAGLATWNFNPSMTFILKLGNSGNIMEQEIALKLKTY